MRTLSTVAAALWIAGTLWAGDTRPAASPPPVVPRKSSAASKSVAKSGASANTDAQLEAAIRAKLAKSKMSGEKFQVHVQGGVATIEGRTDVIQHKGAMTRMARTAGAVGVNNHIRVSDAAKQKSAANLATGRRRAQIKHGDARSEPRSDPRTTAPAPKSPH